MAKRDSDPPLLRGFSTSKTGRGKALTSPTTSIWLAIIFMAIFFALMSVQKNLNNANKAIKPIDSPHSGWIIDSPEPAVKRDPPPNPDLLLNRIEEEPVLVQPDLEFTKKTQPLEIQPIDIEIDVKMPSDISPNQKN